MRDQSTSKGIIPYQQVGIRYKILVKMGLKETAMVACYRDHLYQMVMNDWITDMRGNHGKLFDTVVDMQIKLSRLDEPNGS